MASEEAQAEGDFTLTLRPCFRAQHHAGAQVYQVCMTTCNVLSAYAQGMPHICTDSSEIDEAWIGIGGWYLSGGKAVASLGS